VSRKYTIPDDNVISACNSRQKQDKYSKGAVLDKMVHQQMSSLIWVVLIKKTASMRSKISVVQLYEVWSLPIQYFEKKEALNKAKNWKAKMSHELKGHGKRYWTKF